jgi:hypothetical protein
MLGAVMLVFMPKPLWHLCLSLQVTGVCMWQHDPLLQVQAPSAATNQCVGGSCQPKDGQGCAVCCGALLLRDAVVAASLYGAALSCQFGAGFKSCAPYPFLPPCI